MRLLAVVSYFAFFCSGTAVARQGYTNPVRDSNGDMVRVADPFVYRHPNPWGQNRTSNA